jgi:dynein heavy chain
MTKFDEFKLVFDCKTPHTDPLPGPWNYKLNDFQKMIVLKAIRSDKIISAVEKWIEHD